MLVAIIARDKPGALEIRKKNRGAHLAYIEETDAVAMAGPLMEQGEMAGSLLILDVRSLDDARDWADGDPYAKAGLFASVDVAEWKKVIG